MVDNIGSPFMTGMIQLHGFAIPFTVLVFVGGINAWNMVDGIDGLASVLAFIGLGFFLAVAGWSGPALQASLLALLFSSSRGHFRWPDVRLVCLAWGRLLFGYSGPGAGHVPDGNGTRLICEPLLCRDRDPG